MLFLARRLSLLFYQSTERRLTETSSYLCSAHWKSLEMPATLTTFPNFLRLPAELQIQVWKVAIVYPGSLLRWHALFIDESSVLFTALFNLYPTLNGKIILTSNDDVLSLLHVCSLSRKLCMEWIRSKMTRRRDGTAPKVFVQAERGRIWEGATDEGPFLSTKGP